MMDWKMGPPVLVGERVIWPGNPRDGPRIGTVRWMGNIPEIGPDWCVGVELDDPLLDGGFDGYWKGRKLFECKPHQGLLAPISDIQKMSSRSNSKTSTENHSDLKLDGSQLRDFTLSNLKSKFDKKNPETQKKHRFSALESKLTEWTLRNRTSDRGNVSGSETKNKTPEDRTRKFEDILDRISAKQQHLLKSKSDGKLSLKKRKRKRKSSHDESKRHSKINLPIFPETPEDNPESIDETFENAQTLDSKAFLRLSQNMNEVAGYFKELKDEDGRYDKHETDKPLDGMMGFTDGGHGKEKKFFSFLKWFKKNKDDPNQKFKDSSAASSPMFARKHSSSCESVDTLFSTQTVKSFAYIPPNQYEPSAPPSCLLDFDKYSEDNVFEEVSQPKKEEETESIYDKRKKRRAPQPPRLTRENSLPTTLERKQDEDIDGNKSYHRRTVSESFKDKKAGAYCHVQGKKKAPLPPPSLYPNLQQLTNQYPSLSKKKKPAPPPPPVKSGTDSPNQSRAEKSKEKVETENDQQKTSQIPKKDVSLSPLPSRPWYKRNNRDSNGSNIIKKDLLKGFEWKKNKETEDSLPEVGFSRRSLSTDSTHNKFNIFSRLEKTEDKKKEEKRKSQISILTNISELDREAAEIVRKEQAEEKKMLAENDAKYYSKTAGIQIPKTPPERPKAPNYSPKPESIYNNKKEEFFEKPNVEPKPQKLAEQEKEIIKNKENHLNESKEKTKQNPSPPNISAEANNTKPSQNNINFKVENKELNYLNEPWVCQKCTLENPGWRVFCEICSSVKPRFLFNPKQPPQPYISSSKPKMEPVKLEETEPIPKSQEEWKPEPKPRQQEVTKPEPKPRLQIEEKPEPQVLQIEEPKPKESPPKETINVPEETLEDLRKKRMTFFTSKLENSLERNKVEPELEVEHKPEPRSEPPTDSQIKLKKIIKEMKDSLPKTSSEKEEKDDLADEDVGQEKAKSPVIEKVSLEEVKYGAIKKQQPQPKKEEIAEAYIITKTTVLEDIIIKKADRAPKVTASVQMTKPEPEAGTSDVKPPPRTKKNAETQVTNTKKKTDGPLDLTPVEEKTLNYTQEDLEELTQKLTQAQGLADFRANIETMAPNTEMNTVAVNRLLRRLETAINSGDHNVAAGLAKELALMNINCSVTRQVAGSPSSKITIDMYVEDKVSHQGPIPIQVSPSMTLLQLKKKVQQKMGIPTDVQRWILGKKLATDDTKTLESDGVKTDSCAVFLYLVAPEKKQEPDRPPESPKLVEPEKKLIQKNPSPPKGPGWYFNYEEDRYSYCDESDDSREPSPVTNKKPPVPPSPVRKTPPKFEEVKKPEKPAVVDLKTVEAENEVEKELKLITVNSVRQKVEQLNRTFAENSKQVKMTPKTSQSPEKWKCVACTFVNFPGKFNCSACNAKKVAARFGKPPAPQRPQFLNKAKDRTEASSNGNVHYKALIELQDADLVPNVEPFNCSICLTDYSPGEGVTLKDCLHTFCRTCLISTVQFSEDAEVKCPYMDENYSCKSVMQQREIKALVPRGIFELHLAKSVKEAEHKIGNAFHCKTPDCKGWCIYEDNVNEFHCPVCKYTNCLTCQAIHTGINCRQYQERMKDASETDVDAKKTRDMLEEMVEKGEALACPKCQVVLMKKWGCDWLRCSMCKTEICWVTRGFRWGPGGKGDTTGGCKCGVNGVKCHPKCNYCH